MIVSDVGVRTRGGDDSGFVVDCGDIVVFVVVFVAVSGDGGVVDGARIVDVVVVLLVMTVVLVAMVAMFLDVFLLVVIVLVGSDIGSVGVGGRQRIVCEQNTPQRDIVLRVHNKHARECVCSRHKEQHTFPAVLSLPPLPPPALPSVLLPLFLLAFPSSFSLSFVSSVPFLLTLPFSFLLLSLSPPLSS